MRDCFTRLISSLEPCPTEPTEQTLLYKRKEILFTVCPFYSLQRKGEEESSHWSWDSLWKKKRWFIGCRREWRERNRRFECFLSSLSLLSFSHVFITFQRKKLSSLLGDNFFLSNLQLVSLLSPVLPRGHLQNLEWGPHHLCAPPPPCSKPVFSSDTEGNRGIQFIHTPQRLKW